MLKGSWKKIPGPQQSLFTIFTFTIFNIKHPSESHSGFHLGKLCVISKGGFSSTCFGFVHGFGGTRDSRSNHLLNHLWNFLKPALRLGKLKGSLRGPRHGPGVSRNGGLRTLKLAKEKSLQRPKKHVATFDAKFEMHFLPSLHTWNWAKVSSSLRIRRKPKLAPVTINV